jgi:hypothetical protein
MVPFAPCRAFTNVINVFELIKQLSNYFTKTEFPASLTKRNGKISRDLADSMRTLIQSSTGPL